MSSSKKRIRKKQQKSSTQPTESKKNSDTNQVNTSISDDLSKKLDEVQNKIIKLEKEKSITQVETDALKNSLSNLNLNLEKDQKIIQSLKKEINDLLQDLDTSDTELDEYLKLKNELEVKNEYLNKELSDKERLLDTRNRQFEKLAQDYELVYKKLIEEEKQAKSKKPIKRSSKKIAVESLSQLQEQLKTIEKLEKKLKSKDDEIDELINRLEIQEIKIEELEEEIENEAKSRLRLEKAYNRVKGQV